MNIVPTICRISRKPQKENDLYRHKKFERTHLFNKTKSAYNYF